MSAPLDRPVGTGSGPLEAVSPVVQAVPPPVAGDAGRAAAAGARVRSQVQRSGIGRAFDWVRDPWAVGGTMLLGVGVAAWMMQDALRHPLILPYDAPLALVGTALVAARLGARRVRRQTAHLAVLQAASARMSRATTIEEVGRAIVEETGRILDYHNARVYVSEPPDQVVPIAFEGKVGTYDDVDFDLLRCRLGEGFTGWVAQHGVPLLLDDANADPRGQTIPGTDEVDESMLVVPMHYDERVVGVITLSKLGLRQFAADDLQLLSILADQAATALETARLLARSRGLARELQRMVDMGSALSQSLDPRQVAELMARHMADAFEVDECAISTWDPANDRVVTMGYHPPQRGDALTVHFALAAFPETRRVLELEQVRIVQADDPQADPAEAALLQEEGFSTVVMLPLVAKGRAIGLVELYATSRFEPAGAILEMARSMANEAAMALDNATHYEQAREQADRDPLTGFFNHRYFHGRLGEEILRSSRTHQPVSLLMLDLDQFKQVNDTLGHLVGDRVLVWMADIVRLTLRTTDVPARYGGDEFMVVLPDTDAAAAAVVGERILATFRERPFLLESGATLPIGVSIGVSTHPTDALTATTLISAADAALYAAKRAGGHGVRMATVQSATLAIRESA